MKARILIVGGGAMGTNIALHAASRLDPLREPVVLIEKDRLGAGSSGRAQAIVHQGYSDRGLAAMARDALKVYAGFEAATGRSIGFRQSGVLFLAGPDDPERVRALERDIELHASLGIDARRVEEEEIRQVVHGIRVEQGTIGAFQPEGGFVDSVRAIEVMATLARERGAVTRVGVRNPTILVENGRAIGVETSAGTFYAPQIVLATGPWTKTLLAELGVDLPLQVLRTEQLFVESPSAADLSDDEAWLIETSDPVVADFETRFTPDPFARLPVAHPVLIDLERRFWARCEPRRERTRVGRWGFENLREVRDPDKVSDSVDPKFARWAREALVSRMPVYEGCADLGGQSAWITLSPDGKPIVGAVDELPGLYVVAGFNGNDFQLAPPIGEGLAQILVGQPVSAFDPEKFSMARFQRA